MEAQQKLYDEVAAEFDRINKDCLSMGLSADIEAFPEMRLATIHVLATWLVRIETKLAIQTKQMQDLVDLLKGKEDDDADTPES